MGKGLMKFIQNLIDNENFASQFFMVRKVVASFELDDSESGVIWLFDEEFINDLAKMDPGARAEAIGTIAAIPSSIDKGDGD